MVPIGIRVVLCQDPLNPVHIGGHPSVDTRPVWPSAANTPAGDPDLGPRTVDGTNERSSRVTLAGVLLAFYVACTEHVRLDDSLP